MYQPGTYDRQQTRMCSNLLLSRDTMQNNYCNHRMWLLSGSRPAFLRNKLEDGFDYDCVGGDCGVSGQQ